MAEPLGTFSESWHRIAGQRVYLRPDAVVQRHRYRGERWIVLQNPLSNQFFRLRPAAYEFVGRLRPDRTVQEVWQECVARSPDDAPGQEAVLQLLSQLYFANLLHYEQALDSAQLFERSKKRRQREISSRLLNLMFMRFPLLDPDNFLLRTLPVVGRLISPAGAVLWLVTLGLAIKVVLDNWQSLRLQGQGVLAPGNLPLLYLGLVVIKTIHEFGHAYFCRKFGGEVHVMGVMLMIFTPVPYVDASSSWGLRERSKRILVGAAGVIVELFVAALAVFVWSRTGPGTLHSLAFNMMFVASVSTIIFNINPLLRFDGYYILSDLLEIPNLSQRANQELRHLWEHYIFGVKDSSSAAPTPAEAAWLVVFGIASGIYRVLVFSSVLLLVADRFLLIGLIMAAVCAISWVTVPAGKFIYYLATSPRLQRVRWRACAITAGLAVVLLVLLGVIPFPTHFRAPGVVQAERRSGVINDVPGKVEKLLVQPGSMVSLGQPLLQLTNQELGLALAEAQSVCRETDARLREALSKTNADVKPLESRLEAASSRLEKLKADEAALTVRARHEGIWVAPRIQEVVGRQLDRGVALGLVVNPASFEFVATIPQTDADAAFARQPRKATVRLRGQAGSLLNVSQWTVVPGGKQTLPSPALGWAAGGEVPVSANEPAKAKEPFFEIHANLLPAQKVALLHGRSGTIRFTLAPQPLLQTWLRRLGQLLQKRYQL
ncbi:MAG TPA: biotin/lipoyl-binding protein [Candidatus Binatia bacterium]|jgi:putative peptide zinc metalloprotease protein|nr:biotin/lipoyl-binding protein [Candidatus Binatia bacterium]